MKIKNSIYGKNFIFNNPFSKNRESINDKKLTKYLRTKYKLINFFHINKLYKKSSWFRTMDRYWNKNNSEYQSAVIQNKKKSIFLNSDDVKLYSIVFYDLLPKEFLQNFKIKYLKFRGEYIHKALFDRRIKEINDAFYKMENSGAKGTWYNIDSFNIEEKSVLGKRFSYVTVETVGLSESFYILKYTTYINNSVNKQFDQILKSEIYKEPLCVSNDSWWKRNSFAGCIPYDYGDMAKQYVIEDFLLELKYSFFKHIKNFSFTKMFNDKNYLPTIEIFSSNNLDKNKENIFRLIAPNLLNNFEYNEEDNVFFMPFSNMTNLNDSLNNSKIIADVKVFEQDDKGFFRFEEYEEIICKNFAKYFLLESITKMADIKIYQNHLNIHKVIGSKTKLNKIINLKFKTINRLYYFRRLYNELNKDENNYLDKFYFADYNTLLKNNIITKMKDKNFPYTFKKLYDSIWDSIRDKKKIIDDMFNQIENNAKLLESKYNYKMIKWTFLVGFCTLLVTILFANDMYLIKSFCEAIKNIFKL